MHNYSYLPLSVSPSVINARWRNVVVDSSFRQSASNVNASSNRPSIFKCKSARARGHVPNTQRLTLTEQNWNILYGHIHFRIRRAGRTMRSHRQKFMSHGDLLAHILSLSISMSMFKIECNGANGKNTKTTTAKTMGYTNDLYLLVDADAMKKRGFFFWSTTTKTGASTLLVGLPFIEQCE